MRQRRQTRLDPRTRGPVGGPERPFAGPVSPEPYMRDLGWHSHVTNADRRAVSDRERARVVEVLDQAIAQLQEEGLEAWSLVDAMNAAGFESRAYHDYVVDQYESGIRGKALRRLVGIWKARALRAEKALVDDARTLGPQGFDAYFALRRVGQRISKLWSRWDA